MVLLTVHDMLPAASCYHLRVHRAPAWHVTHMSFVRSCSPAGRFHHAVESRAALRLAGHDAKSIKPVTEDAAVSIGATVFSELVVFSVAGGVLLFELHKKAQDDDLAKVKKDAAL